MTTVTHSIPRIKKLERHLPFGITLPMFSLGLIILLAAFLRLYDLGSVGDGNLYYTAAVKSMLESFHNFFFVSAEPGGSVTVDKPPLGLWIQAGFAAVLGVNGIAVVLPQVIAGILAIPVTYSLVKRYSNELGGLIAAFVLAVTPVSIVVERNNTMDATLLFTLLIAAWAFMKASDAEKHGWRWLMLGGVIVGLAFNIKMLQAYLPVPAFYALYFLGSKTGWFKKIGNLALATIVMLMVSFSWSVAVDLVPADQRPYIGSSENNTVLELTFGHNGLSRLFGPNRGGNGPANAGPQNQPPQNGAPPANGLPPGAPPQGQGPTSPLGDEVGSPGALRLFTAPLSNEVSWLLPFGLIALLIVLFSSRIALPLTELHKGLVLWGGWLVTTVVFFSVAEFFHAYYMVMLGAPLAAMVGLGIYGLWRLYQNHPTRAVMVLAGGVVLTIVIQIMMVYQYLDRSVFWIVIPVLVGFTGLFLLTANIFSKDSKWTTYGSATLVSAMLIIPTIWAGLTSFSGADVNLPSAYGDHNDRPVRNNNDRSNVNQDILTYLEAHTANAEYLLAVQSAQQGAGYVLETGRPVLYMGGFGGGDPVVNLGEVQEMVNSGELQYFLISQNGRGGPNSSGILSWIQDTCEVVDGVGGSAPDQVPPPNQPLPDGGPGGPGGPPPPGFRGGTMLYDCGG